MDAFCLRLSLAYLLDLAIGDPRGWPHPVRVLGWAIKVGERLFRAWVRREEWAGRLLVVTVVAGTWLAVRACLSLAYRAADGLGLAVEVGLLYACLSTRDLAVETWPVLAALERADLDRAREKLRMIVGRDTDALDEPQIVRAAVETVAESTLDGIVAPLFYAVVGGTPLACVYKAVNTLDSMVGHRSARYIRFGQAAAQLDRWMNRIPAGWTAGLILVAGALCGKSAPGAWRALRPRAIRRENSFLVEAAMAGVLGVELGGVNFYQGIPVETPRMGRPQRPLHRTQIREAIQVMVVASLVGFVLALTVRWGMGCLRR